MKALVDSKSKSKNTYSKPTGEALLKIVYSYLNQDAFTIPKQARETDRLPPSFGVGRKRPPEGNKWIQMAGCIRSNNGAPLKRRIGEKNAFSYKLLKLIHKSLKEMTVMGIMKDEKFEEPIIIISEKGTLNFSTCYYPRLILEKKITFLGAVKKLDSNFSTENSARTHFVLWRY